MASEARRVHSQHTQLHALLGELRRTLETGSDQTARGVFENFADASDAHMRVEETLYFPALHGLMPEVDPELIALRDEHVALRESVARIGELLAARERDAARDELDRLAERSARHEAVEESLIERVRGAAGGGAR